MKEIEINVDSYEAEANDNTIKLKIYTDCEEVINKFSHDEIVNNVHDSRKLFEKLKLILSLE